MKRPTITSFRGNPNMQLCITARFAMSIARAIAGVIVPIYLSIDGYSVVKLGVLFAIVAATSALMSTAVGFLADRIGRRFFLVLIPLLTALAAVAFAVSNAAAVVVIGAALGSFGRGGGAGAGNVGPYLPAEQALIAASVSDRERTPAFARLGLATTFGSLLGGLMVSVLVTGHATATNLLPTYRVAFIALACFAGAAGIIALWIREPPLPPVSREARRRFFPQKSRGLVFRLWITNGLNGAAIGLFGPFITYWFYRRYGVSAAQIGLLFAVINATSLISNMTVTSLSRRLGLVRATTLLRIVVSLLLIPMVLAPTFLIAGAIYLVRMFGQRMALPLRQSYVMGMADPEERSRVAALSNLPAQALSAVTPALAGELFAVVDLAAPFLLSSVLQLANALTFYGFFKNATPREERVAPEREAPTSASVTTSTNQDEEPVP
ncbi:MAG: MFS transporter [Acidimicrobiales bacterium]